MKKDRSPSIGIFLKLLNRGAVATLMFFVLPIAAVGPFTDNGDGTITDASTKLKWQKCTAGQANDATCTGEFQLFDWKEAGAYCKSLDLANKKWRLPTIQELFSLVDYARVSPATDPVFVNTPNKWYWASNIMLPLKSDFYWSISFEDGYVSRNHRNDRALVVRCVTK